eukprot:scaffold4002_cov17-Tisochrysis_lutea.AAC.1
MCFSSLITAVHLVPLFARIASNQAQQSVQFGSSSRASRTFLHHALPFEDVIISKELILPIHTNTFHRLNSGKWRQRWLWSGSWGGWTPQWPQLCAVPNDRLTQTGAANMMHGLMHGFMHGLMCECCTSQDFRNDEFGRAGWAYSDDY